MEIEPLESDGRILYNFKTQAEIVKDQLQLGRRFHLNDPMKAEEYYLSAHKLGNTESLVDLVRLTNGISPEKVRTYAQMGLEKGQWKPAQLYINCHRDQDNIDEAEAWLRKITEIVPPILIR